MKGKTLTCKQPYPVARFPFVKRFAVDLGPNAG
jgi:hypothetical protein